MRSTQFDLWHWDVALEVPQALSTWLCWPPALPGPRIELSGRVGLIVPYVVQDPLSTAWEVPQINKFNKQREFHSLYEITPNDGKLSGDLVY